jgi:hypothetical protein
MASSTLRVFFRLAATLHEFLRAGHAFGAERPDRLQRKRARRRIALLRDFPQRREHAFAECARQRLRRAAHLLAAVGDARRDLVAKTCSVASVALRKSLSAFTRTCDFAWNAGSAAA